MNNLAYSSQKIENIGPKIEEKIREEIGATAPLDYEVSDGDVGRATAGSFLGDIANAATGGKVKTLYRLSFDLPQPRPTTLHVSVNRQGVGTYVGTLLYTAVLARSVAEEAVLQDPKFFGTSKFTGGQVTSAKLNANGELLKRINKLARTESQSGGLTLTIKRFCKVVPDGEGAVFVLTTLPRAKAFSVTVDAQEFLDVAALVEAAL